MDNVALVFLAKDTLEAGDSGYGALVSAWTAGMVGRGYSWRRDASGRRLWPQG
jgi:hypothetical protein